MLKKSMSKSAMMVALVTGSVIWGVHGTRRGTKPSIYTRSDGRNRNTDRKKRC